MIFGPQIMDLLHVQVVLSSFIKACYYVKQEKTFIVILKQDQSRTISYVINTYFLYTNVWFCSELIDLLYVQEVVTHFI